MLQEKNRPPIPLLNSRPPRTAPPHPTALLILLVPPAPAPSLKHAWSHLALRSPFPSPPPIRSTRIPAVDSLKLFLPILFSPSHESCTPHVIARVVLLALVGWSRREARPLMRPRQAHAANRKTPAAESACGQTKIHSARKRKHRRPKESACSQTKLPVASTKTPASKQKVPAAEESTCGQFEVVIYKPIHLTSDTATSTHLSFSPNPPYPNLSPTPLSPTRCPRGPVSSYQRVATIPLKCRLAASTSTYFIIHSHLINT